MVVAENHMQEGVEEFKMDIKLLNKNKEKTSFLVKNTDTVFINTLRRNIISNVPTLAIDTVKFIKNSSALYDEILAHRFGLVTLKTDLKSYSLKSESKAKKSSTTELILTLSCKGPCTVYGGDLTSKDPKVKAIYPKTVIVKLSKGQELKLEATAILGTGKKHTKFSPGLSYYQGYPEINILKPNASGVVEAVKICPTKVFRAENKQLKVHDLEKCNLCNACVELLGENIIDVKGSNKDFIVHLESWGQLKNNEILDKAIDVMDDKLDEFESQIKKIK
jgi:DNA-directed RNA polymerase subunit D